MKWIGSPAKACRSTAAVVLLPVAIALAAFLLCMRKLPPLGDEPHYLIMADSVYSDLDLDLKNNYLRDFDTRRIIGLITPHVYNVPRGWMPYHTPGLGILLAIPFGLGGIVGARLALIALTAVLPWSLVTFLRSTPGPGQTSTLVALGLSISLPIVADASQIYPDLPGGLMVTALTLWLIRHTVANESNSSVPSTWSWAGFWLLTGLLPWLHVKYAATAICLAAGALALTWSGPRRVPAPTSTAASGPSRSAFATLLLTSPLLLFGFISLVLFHQWAFGMPLGVRGARELTSSPSRAAMMFLGLHLDQSQGMFVQQPLLLAGVAAFPLFVRLRPRLAVFWTALYAAAILPNSLELARFGGGGPVGRFGWTAAWLWSIPIGIALISCGSCLARYVRPAVFATLIYQAALALRWMRTPAVLFPSLDPPRDSLFPDVMRPWLPSFYFWDFSSYWRFGPNIVALLTVALIFASGLWAAWRQPVCNAADREGPREGVVHEVSA